LDRAFTLPECGHEDDLLPGKGRIGLVQPFELLAEIAILRGIGDHEHDGLAAQAFQRVRVIPGRREVKSGAGRTTAA